MRNAGIEGMEAVPSPTDPAVLSPEAREALSLNRALNYGNRKESCNWDSRARRCASTHASAIEWGGRWSRFAGVQSGA